MTAELRILHQVDLSNNAWGGVEKHFSAFVMDEAAAGTVDNFFAGRLKKTAAELEPAFAALNRPPLDVRRPGGVPLPAWPKRLRALPMHWAMRRWQPNRILNWNRFGQLLPARLAQRYGGKAVHWERGAAWFDPPTDYDPGFAHAYPLYLANSQASKQMLIQRWKVEARRIQVCAPGVVLNRQPDAAPRQRTPGRPLRLGMVARLRAFKGGVLAVHAMQVLASRLNEAVELHIAGDGPDTPAIQAQITQLGLQDRVRLHGKVSPIDDFIDKIDLLVHPALREPYGLACAEAMAHGVPVIACQVDGLPEVIGDEGGGLCVPAMLPLSKYPQYGGDLSDVYSLVYRPASADIGEPKLPDPVDIAAAIERLADPDQYARASAAAVRAHQNRLSFPIKQAAVLQALRSMDQN